MGDNILLFPNSLRQKQILEEMDTGDRIVLRQLAIELDKSFGTVNHNVVWMEDAKEEMRMRVLGW